MRLALPAPPEMYPWLTKRAPILIGPGFGAIAAIDDDGEIAGMVGYDGVTPGGCSMHVAIDKPIAVRTLIRPAFEIPFVRMNKPKVFGTVLSNNEKALKFDKSLGFREVARIKDAWDAGIDYVILEMTRDECRWIRKEAA